MRKTTIAIILGLAITVTTGAAASDIYKWTDKDGNAQYGDRPTEGAVRLTTIESRSTNHARIAATAQARRERQVAADEAAAAEPQGPSDEELRAQAEERAGQCKTSRGRLEKLITSRRLYREDGNGERVYLGDNEMQTAREHAQSLVEEYCSS